ncbi:hypothetical protein ARMGADRAFT_1159515 [Armillaria gallica]|uniref:Protein kinase domain-containing protein n=1 Tax=Armillaria gallica TaxID=47427 RepID=A0A2H3EG80_ARMGA|nr:hypothetical protein ARMGADRAFT_1159515 [Armillaria gallica]
MTDSAFRKIRIELVRKENHFLPVPISNCTFDSLPEGILETDHPRFMRRPMALDALWHYGEENYTNDRPIHFAARFHGSKWSGPDTLLFEIKMAVHVEFGPGSCPDDVKKDLIREATFHATNLKHLQGKIVPIHYGIWTAETTWGGTVVCSITERRGIPWRAGGPHDTLENRMAIASVMQDLHCSGFRHGQLGAGIESHLLWDPRRNQPVIIDFKNAELTPCKHKLPLAIMEAKPLSWMLCGELIEVGFYLKLWGDKKFKDDPIAHKLFHDFRSHKCAESGTLAAPPRNNHADSSPS